MTIKKPRYGNIVFSGKVLGCVSAILVIICIRGQLRVKNEQQAWLAAQKAKQEENRIEEEKMRKIVRDVSNLFELTNESKAATPGIMLKGKALVWDSVSDAPSQANNLLPDSIKATSGDDEITVFLLLKPRNEMAGTFSISGAAAYKVSTDIAVARWPKKSMVGFHTVTSYAPRERQVIFDTKNFEVIGHPPDSYGDSIRPIADWINSLMKL